MSFVLFITMLFMKLFKVLLKIDKQHLDPLASAIFYYETLAMQEKLSLATDKLYITFEVPRQLLYILSLNIIFCFVTM